MNLVSIDRAAAPRRARQSATSERMPSPAARAAAAAIRVKPVGDIERAFIAPRGGVVVELPCGARYGWRSDGACEMIVSFAGGRATPLRAAALRGMHADALRIAVAHAAGRRHRPSPEFTTWFSARAKASLARPAARAAGFRPSHEGAGSTGWRKALPCGDELRVCARGGDMDGHPRDEIWFAARLSRGGGLVELASPMAIRDALDAAAALPSPVRPDGSELVATYLTVRTAVEAASEATPVPHAP